MNFYGFNWQDIPAYSRLFSPSVVNRAQSAYGQGMKQFTPYDPQQLEQMKAAKEQQAAQASQNQPAQSSGKFYLSPDGRLIDVSGSDFTNRYLKLQPGYNPQRPNDSTSNQLSMIGGVLSSQTPEQRAASLLKMGYKPY